MREPELAAKIAELFLLRDRKCAQHLCECGDMTGKYPLDQSPASGAEVHTDKAPVVG